MRVFLFAALSFPFSMSQKVPFECTGYADPMDGDLSLLGHFLPEA